MNYGTAKTWFIGLVTGEAKTTLTWKRLDLPVTLLRMKLVNPFVCNCKKNVLCVILANFWSGGKNDGLLSCN